MSKINDIKQRIQQLDPGSFQLMCDMYLSKIGYPNIVSLGTHVGTQKTTRGTPDTYFFDANGKYVFVEYTTQQDNLPSKIQTDIEKCLDVSYTQIPHNKISEIIYCHTSSNISPKYDAAFRKMCESVGIQFSIYGIDKLAIDIYLKHRGIAKDFLHIAIDTNQIESIEDFVRHYDSSKLAAPLATQFLFREDVLESMDALFEKTNIVVLTGPAGTGKTRLALHYAESYSHKTDSQLLCIHDNALPIYEDLTLYMENPGRYMLIVDDANQLSGLKHVIQYANKQSEGYQVRILITVRDYAISKVKKEIHEISSFEIMPISLLSDDQIKQLVKQELGIKNDNYLNRIARLAEGNSRIAMLAGKIAYNSNRLDSIDDITQLYSEYYSRTLTETGIEKDRQLLSTAGLIAFLRTLHIDYINPLESVLIQCKLTKEIFIEKIYELHKLEIVDICNDKAVRFEDQCFANYILKYVYYDKKIISLRDMIISCFGVYKERTLFAINTLVGVYHTSELHTFVEEEIKAVWKELSSKKDTNFFEYVKAFYPVNPVETLIMMQEIIENEKLISIPIDNLKTNFNKNYRSINNEILIILGGFADTENIESALDLFFNFYQKRPDLFSEFYHTITTYYSISKHSYKYGYYTQIKLLEKFKEYSHNWSNRFVTELFLAIAPKFLGLRFDGIENERRKTATFYSFSLILTEGVEKYRAMIWEVLYDLCSDHKYKNQVYNILKNYGHSIDESGRYVVNFDSSYIVSIMEYAFPSYYLPNCVLAEKLTAVLSTNENTFHFLDTYLNTPKFTLYRILKGPKHSLTIRYEEREKIKKEAIDQYIQKCSIEDFYDIIDTCKECMEYDGDNSYEITKGLESAIHSFSFKDENFSKAVRYYLKLNTPFNIYPIAILRDLFRVLLPFKVLELISSEEYENKNSWMYAYYHELPENAIDALQVQGLYTFLQSDSDATLTLSFNRNVDFLEKYQKVDACVIVKASKIILSKVGYSRFIPHLYFSLLFNYHHNSPESVIAKYKSNLELLEDIYIESISYSSHNDYDGQFLKEIYRVSPTILKKFINKIICTINSSHFDEYKEKILAFYDFDNYNQVFDTMLNSLIESVKYAIYIVPDFIKTIIVPKQNKDQLTQKQDQWIKHFINNNYSNKEKMKYLFCGISYLPSERKVNYLQLLLHYNPDYEMFKSLPLFPLTGGWTNSAVPYLTSRARYLEQILPLLTGLKYIRHKKYIESIIDSLKNQIEQEEIRDILDS